jgi:FkbM family methyltransferase
MIKLVVKKILKLFQRRLYYTFGLVSTNDNKIVKKKIWGADLLIPQTHAILDILTNVPHYQHNLKKIVKLASSKYKNEAIVDIGANIGYTLALIKEQTNNTVVCVEGDPKYYSLLSKNAAQFSNVLLIDKFIGNANAHTHNFTTLKDKGTLRIVEQNTSPSQSDNIEFIHAKDIFEKAKKISLIKIDTDGFDLQIIQHAMPQLNDNPILFFEYDPVFFLPYTSDWKTFFLELNKIGYTAMIIYDHLGALITSIEDFASPVLYHLHNYISTKENLMVYYDICVFADKDNDIFQELLKN